MSDLLTDILNHKRQEIIQRKEQLAFDVLKKQVKDAPLPRGFLGDIHKKLAAHQPAVIAEIKKASPSKGVLRHDFDPLQIAKEYVKAGATCLSVLTDEKFFQGNARFIEQIRAMCDLPILRKDFIIDAYQIYESRLIGADGILLIVAALNDNQLQEFSQLAQTLKLDVLVEIHDAEELQRALKLSIPLLGINNRNLRTFETDLTTTLNLLPFIPTGKIVVTESGIYTVADIKRMRQHDVHVFLIGESLMRAEHPGEKLAELVRS